MSLHIRLMGLESECADGVAVLRLAFRIRSVSPWHRNRGESELGRVYIEADAPADLPDSEVAR